MKLHFHVFIKFELYVAHFLDPSTILSVFNSLYTIIIDAGPIFRGVPRNVYNTCNIIFLNSVRMIWYIGHIMLYTYAGIEFKDFILGFRQSTFLCTTLKCIEKFRIPFIKPGIPASNLGSSEARNPAKLAACYV